MTLTSQPAAALLLSIAIAISPAAAAQERAGEGHQSPHDDSDVSTAIVVAGHLPTDYALLEGTMSLSGDDLAASARGQIGEMLARLPGVSATSFAPGVSRPVLRGFDGDRVRVLVDGIGSIDASSVSADHAVVFDPLTVDHIDVLHGPAVLLYGGQAIGGAVNGIDKRIPRRVPDSPEFHALAGLGSAARERSAGAAIDIPLDARFVGHLDAGWRKSSDVRVPGYVNARQLRGQLLDEAADFRAAGDLARAEALSELAGQQGRVPNSAASSHTLGAGLAFIDAGGNLGISVQRFDTRYGVPLRPGAGDDPEAVAIDLVQTRFDLRGGVELGGFIKEIQFRGAFGDYRHVELEGAETGTRFDGKGIEFRLDLVQSDREGWRGRSGITYLTRKLAVTGEEAIFPAYQVDRIGAFTLQSLDLGAGFEGESAGRYEQAIVRSGPAGFRRTFDLWSGAAGVSYVPTEGWKLGLNFIRGARSPAPEELLTQGLHIATQAYEAGDSDFRVESSKGFEAFVRFKSSRAEFSLTAYRTRFDNFIAAVPTGEEREGFPVFRYRQVPARYQGLEAMAEIEAMRWSGGSLRVELAGDYVDADLSGIGPAPRIPPLRLKGGVSAKQGNLHLHAGAEWNRRQNRVAAFDAQVAGFTTVNFGADWHPFGDDGPITLLLDGQNLFNQTARRAASFTRDFVPLPGRDIRLTVKLDF